MAVYLALLVLNLTDAIVPSEWIMQLNWVKHGEKYIWYNSFHNLFYMSLINQWQDGNNWVWKQAYVIKDKSPQSYSTHMTVYSSTQLADSCYKVYDKCNYRSNSQYLNKVSLWLLFWFSEFQYIHLVIFCHVTIIIK